MPQTCTQSFDITINDVVTPPPYAYYKCDDVPVTTLVDQVSAQNLLLTSGAPSSVAGKIGTAIQIGGGTNTVWGVGPDAYWAFSDSFTIRFWYNPTFDGNDNVLISGDQFDIHKTSPAGLITILECELETTTGWTPYLDSDPLTNSGWNHVMFWFENGVGIGIKINDGPPTLISATDPIVPMATAVFGVQMIGAMGPDILDEISIWNVKLTDAEMTYDYNAGAGRTWP